ncbi:MAG: CpaF family protein [Lachnospiraceae bacterium]|jgi:pilus assembly protein CpaF|nr:CpaF family protein [Lachnospiraceae bacterium]
MNDNGKENRGSCTAEETESEDALRKRLKEELMSEIDFSRDQSDEDIISLIDEMIIKEKRSVSIPLKLREDLRRNLFHSVRKLDILQDIVDDPLVTEIMVNGPEDIFVERAGRLSKYPSHFESVEKLDDVIQLIVSSCNRVVNESSPIVDARLAENGARVNVVMRPIALNGPILTIRRFPDKPIEMEDLIKFGSLSEEISEWLGMLVKAKYNIFISGGTGSGKTTFLNALSAFIPSEERIITIEDSAELQIHTIPNIVRMETRNANVEGCVPVTIRDLIRSSLRMRPDRIVVGEVRGAEAIDMMQCLNTGHDGSMSTGHANSARDMLTRLETMILMGMEIPLQAVRAQIASGIDVIVHLGRLRDKSRRVLEITEIAGFFDGEIQLNPLYVFKEEGIDESGHIIGELVRSGEMIHHEKLETAGFEKTRVRRQ